ncbi:MAG: CHASE2 domain-containing protein [Burkholderiales bacterium]|nr:CHASE2 domain-containing protein [Burkholderiales bacterium]
MWYFIKSALVALGLLGVQFVLHATPPGQWIERETYALLADQLPLFRLDGPAVTVLDISHISGGATPGRADEQVTPRGELRTLLDAIAAERPLAVAIDIDFSPDHRGWKSREDPAFFDHCLALGQRGTPVRLGVYRGLREPPEGWLGAARFADLAGGVWLPKTGSRRLPVSFHVDGVAGAARPLPSLGAALAGAAGPREPRKGLVAGLVEPLTIRRVPVELVGPPLVVVEALVNYSVIEQLSREQLVAASPRDIANYADRIRGRLVIVGDTRVGSSDDIFAIPGDPANRRGVLLHAALAHTLLVEPVHEFKHGVRWSIDILLSALILAGVALVAWLSRGKADTHKVESWFVLGTVACVVLVGFAFIYFVRVLWLDFLLVGAFLLIHPSVGRWAQKLAQTVRTRWPRLRGAP